jgi:glycosyltransferase involved in cell wall biosynthesis
MRYAWDLQHEYLNSAGLAKGMRGWLARWMLHKLRVWDARSSLGVDACAANSGFIARRIVKAYRRDAAVIYPPVDVDRIAVGTAREDFYLTASRLVPYKRIDAIVQAFASMPSRRLVVIGDGPEFETLRALATSNVELLGFQSTPTLHDYLGRARAFVFAGLEDFGIILAEAQAAGAPIIAYGHGGAAEIVRGLDDPRPTGVFFEAQTPAAICDAVERFEKHPQAIDPLECRANAERFRSDRFRDELAGFIAEAEAQFHNRPNAAPIHPALPRGVQPSHRAAA